MRIIFQMNMIISCQDGRRVPGLHAGHAGQGRLQAPHRGVLPGGGRGAREEQEAQGGAGTETGRAAA